MLDAQRAEDSEGRLATFACLSHDGQATKLAGITSGLANAPCFLANFDEFPVNLLMGQELNDRVGSGVVASEVLKLELGPYRFFKTTCGLLVRSEIVSGITASAHD